MKCIGSFIILAVLNLVSVLAGPPPTVWVTSGDLEYYMPGGTNFFIASTPVNKNAKTITVKPTITYNGKKYNTRYFSGIFGNSAAERIIFPNSFSSVIDIAGFETAKKLKVIQVDTPNARLSQTYSQYVDRNVSIEGTGVEGMMFSYAKDLLSTLNFRGIPKYNANNIDQRKCSLYNVDKFVHNNFNYIPVQYGNNYDNGVHTLLYREGNSLGLARATRILAIAAGYNRNAIRTGGDGMNFGFNYVEFNKKWYILDYPFTSYNSMDRDQCHPSFKTSSELIPSLNSFYGKGVRLTNDVFVIHHGVFGFNGEVSEPKSENFKSFLKRKNLGTLM
jgi:hypothetical protein